MNSKTHNLTSANTDSKDCEIVLLESRPLVPDGNYHFKLRHHETAIMFKNPKLILHLEIAEFGDYHGIVIPNYYNVSEIYGPPKKRGRFKPTKGGDFLIDYFNLVGAGGRLDRLSMKPLYNSFIYARTETVTKNNQGKKLPPQLQYSKIAEMVELRDDLPE